MFKKIAIAAAAAFVAAASVVGTGSSAEAKGYKKHGVRYGHVIVIKKNYYGHGFGHVAFKSGGYGYGYGYRPAFIGYQPKPVLWLTYSHNRRWH